MSSPGVRLAKGRLALVDGVRTLIADDGAFRQAADAQRLDSLLLVPGASGPVVVGVAGRAVLRFDEPLGPGAPITRAAADITAVGAWPGLVSVSTATGTRWFDLEGRPRPAPIVPSPHASAFLDARVGVALFPISGPAFTRDGGASWSLLDAPEVATVDADEGWLRLRPSREGAEDARVDVAKGGVSRPPPPRPRDPPFVRWLRDAGDPLLAAVSSGVMVGTTRALVASGDLMAEVDLVTGLPVAFTSLAGTHDPSWPLPGAWEATPARAPGTARDPSTRSVYFSRPDHVGPVLLVELAAPREPRTVFDATPRETRFVASSSGGWMVAAACPGDAASGEVRCVGQPDGSRRSVRAALSYAGPRADGGLVGIRDGENETTIVAVDAAGEPRTLATRTREDGERLALSAALDELPTGALLAPYTLGRMRGVSEAGVMLVQGGSVSLVPAGEASATTTVRCLAGRCVGVAPDGSQASFDVAAGVWRREAGPGRIGRAPLRVSEVGWSSGRGVHLGWGAGDPPPPDDVVIPPPEERAPLSVVCDIGPARAGSLPYLRAVEGDPVEIYQALVPPRVAARDRRSQTHGIGVFAAQGVLATDADPDVATSRGTLSFHWVDHTELGARARHAALPGWTGSFPYIASIVASRDHAVFVSSSEPTTVGRATGGRLEVTRFPHKALSSGAFSADGTFAWWTDEQGIGHWPARGAPRVLAGVARGSVAIGAPTAEGVPVMAYDRGWAAVRVVPASDPPPGRLDVAGWRPTPFSLDALATLPVCARGAAGHRFSLPVDVDVVLPGTPPAFGRRSELAVRVSPDAACLDGVFFEQHDRFARIDLRGGVAEGGEAGLRGRVTSLTCRVPRAAVSAAGR